MQMRVGKGDGQAKTPKESVLPGGLEKQQEASVAEAQ